MGLYTLGNTAILWKNSILVCTVTSAIECVETLAQNCSSQALGTAQYLKAEVSNSLF